MMAMIKSILTAALLVVSGLVMAAPADLGVQFNPPNGAESVEMECGGTIYPGVTSPVRITNADGTYASCGDGQIIVMRGVNGYGKGPDSNGLLLDVPGTFSIISIIDCSGATCNTPTPVP